MDDRQLALSYILVLSALLFLIFAFGFTSNKKQVLIPLVLVLGAVLIISNLLSSLPYIEDMHVKGRGYTSAYWHNAPILEEIEQIPSWVTLISNEPEALNFLLDRRAYLLPELQTKVPVPIDESFGSNSQGLLHALFRETKAALVIFTAGNSQFFPLYGENTPERLNFLVEGLDHQYERRDGGIYWYRSDHP